MNARTPLRDDIAQTLCVGTAEAQYTYAAKVAQEWCDRANELMRQNDELVAALQEIATCGSSINDAGECIELRADRCRRVARAALAKVQP